MIKRLTNVFFHWLPVGAAIFILCGFVYGAVQQNFRQGLNDPQVTLVGDVETALLSGAQPAEIIPRTNLIDVEKSLSPFVAIYDVSGTPLESSASVGNIPPQPPKGVFDYAKAHGEDRVTWQPNKTTRIALVVKYVASNPPRFVASGRNMSEVESRISKLTLMTALALLAALIVSFALDCVGDNFRRKQMGGV